METDNPLDLAQVMSADLASDYPFRHADPRLSDDSFGDQALLPRRDYRRVLPIGTGRFKQQRRFPARGE